MRLHPPVSQDEATSWLTTQTTQLHGEQVATAMSEHIDTLAEAMSMLSGLELPDDLEPLFP